MIVLQIENIREFMVQLFQGTMFDKFCVNGCEITTFVRFQTDGKRNESWYDTGEREEDTAGRVRWRELKPVIFSLIRGKKTPARMVIDFCHFMPDRDMGSLRIEYKGERLFAYTGYMQHEFTPDKSKQQEWDDNCLAFMKKNQIISTQLD